MKKLKLGKLLGPVYKPPPAEIITINSPEPEKHGEYSFEGWIHVPANSKLIIAPKESPNDYTVIVEENAGAVYIHDSRISKPAIMINEKSLGKYYDNRQATKKSK